MAISTISLSTFKWFSNKHKPSTSSNPPPLPLVVAVQPLAEAAFRHLDADGDGKISGDELRTYFASIGEYMTRDDARSVIGDYDGDGDELLDLRDFEQLIKAEKEEDQEEDLKRAFEMFEVEKGCGFIGPLGLQKMFQRLGFVKSKEECMTMIKVFDVDCDGVIDYREFLKMMTP